MKTIEQEILTLTSSKEVCIYWRKFLNNILVSKKSIDFIQLMIMIDEVDDNVIEKNREDEMDFPYTTFWHDANRIRDLLFYIQKKDK